jgi:hypothetical protein
VLVRKEAAGNSLSWLVLRRHTTEMKEILPLSIKERETTCISIFFSKNDCIMLHVIFE